MTVMSQVGTGDFNYAKLVLLNKHKASLSTMPMRILYTNFHRRSTHNGHVTYVMSLARALSTRHHIVVASPRGSRLLLQAQAETSISAVAQPFPNRIWKLAAAARQFRRLIVQTRIDIVHANGSADHLLAMVACLGLRRAPRIVYTKHNDLPISPWAARLHVWTGTHHVIGVCESVRDALGKTPYARVPLTAIPNGVDTRHFDRETFLAQLGAQAAVAALREGWSADVEPNPLYKEAKNAGPYTGGDSVQSATDMLILGSHAGTVDYKGWLHMVQAVARLDQPVRSRIRIVLAGVLPTAAQRLGVAQVGMTGQVHFTGPLEDVRAFVAALDVGFVLSWRETISFACREMMAMGVPVIVSNHGGLPENIDDSRNGWIVDCHDIDAIARLVQYLATHSDEVARMGIAAKLRAQSAFGLSAYVAATENVYHQVLAV
jgi:glycosyltransferase involved in cell wall biosynthesis